MDGLQRGPWIEGPVGQQDRRSGIHRRHGPDHATVAMKQRHRQADPVLFRIVESMGQELPVVHNVVVGQHDALGQAGGAAGVLDVGHVVHGYMRWQFARRILQRGPLGRIEVDGVIELEIEPVAGAAEDLFVVGALVFVPQEERLHARLLQRVLQLMGAVGGIHIDERRSGPGAAHVHRDPLDAVGGPQADAVAPPNAERPKPSCHAVRFVAQLGPGQALGLMAGRNGQAVGKAIRCAVQEVADGQVQQRPVGSPRVAQGAGFFFKGHDSGS